MAQGRQMKISITETHPEIAAQWHLTKNGDLRPEDFTYGSHKKVWWQCPVAEDHEWEATIKSRKEGNGCPYCSGRRATKLNCLSITHPEIAAQWHPTKNGDKKPDSYMAGSHEQIWWRCPIALDHEWQASIKDVNRNNGGNGCPCCHGIKTVQSNCLSTTHPKIAAQWHLTKNGDKKPENYTYSSHEKMWWQCLIVPNHVWQTTINHRTRGRNCPYCNASKGENLIEIFLRKNRIKFKKEYRFKTCIRKRSLPFDFIVKCKNIKLIEYQGEQHYKPIFGSSEYSRSKAFEDIQESDAIKKNWCINNNIDLLAIPYWNFDIIPEILKKFLEINT
jgi:hypothetical protein